MVNKPSLFKLLKFYCKCYGGGGSGEEGVGGVRRKHYHFSL